MKRVLVAGATGYLGRFVAQEFKARGHFVRALARTPKKLDDIRDSLDEVVQGEVTRPETLAALCDGIDVVFSSMGVTRQQDNLTFKDVDFQGNVNLLEVAQRAGVKKFIYVSVFATSEMRQLDIVKAHEDFVDVLEASGIDYTVIRPTGYFSDMSEFLKMARNGRIYLIGRGDNRTNPIHGADLAEVCVDAVEGELSHVDIGGPNVFTYRQMAEIAFASAGRPVRITCIPTWAARAVVGLTRLVNRHKGELLAFFVTAMSSDLVAPSTGKMTIDGHFRKVGEEG
jgi:uncharacterized protein YbjT (DUF2867 family)